jgi:hypothetical protein
MSLTALLARRRPLTATWHSSLTCLPTGRQPATPFHSREWAAAWQHVRTEQVRTSHHLLLQGDNGPHRLSFHQVQYSPMWRALEEQADVTDTFQHDVLYGPTIYSQYGGLPGAPVPLLASAVERGRALARDRGTDALVIANILPAERSLWRQASLPDAEVVLSWAHHARLPGTIEEFAGRIPSAAARRDFEQAHRTGTARGLRLTIAKGPALRPHLKEFTVHAEQDKHGRPLYGLDMLLPLTHVPGAVGLLAHDPHGNLAGGFFAFRYGPALHLWTAAVDPNRQEELHTYEWLMHESVRYAIATGAHVLDAGRGCNTYKTRLGMQPVALTSAVYLTRPNARLKSRLSALQTGLTQDTLYGWNSD